MYCVPPNQKESNYKRSVTPDHDACPKKSLALTGSVGDRNLEKKKDRTIKSEESRRLCM